MADIEETEFVALTAKELTAVVESQRKEMDLDALRLHQFERERDTYLEAARYLVRYVVPLQDLQRLAARWPFLLPDDCPIEEEEEGPSLTNVRLGEQSR